MNRTQRTFLLALTIVFLGYLLRTYAIAQSTLRGDEAFSIGFAAQPLPEIFARMGNSEPNPPLYWLLLNGWLRVAGNSELATRFLSALLGTLTVALTHKVARQLTTRGTSFLAALFIAANPFIIWYAQDVRPYALLTALIVGAVWRTWQAGQTNSTKDWGVAAGLWWLALFDFYFALFSLALTALAFLLTPHSRRHWPKGLISTLLIALAYLPWALYVWPLLSGHVKDWIAPASAWEALNRVLVVSSVGLLNNGATTLTQVIGALICSVLLLGALPNLWQRQREPAWWLIFNGVGLPLLLWLISLVRPVFIEQYFISALPFMAILLAVGVTSVNHRLGAASLTVIFITLNLLSLQNYFFDPAYRKGPNWLELTSYLASTAQPHDVIVLNVNDPAFSYYYHGATPVETSPPTSLNEDGLAQAEKQLNSLRTTYDRIRFFYAPHPQFDPDSYVEKWLSACCELLHETFLMARPFQEFNTPRGSLAAMQPFAIRFGDGVALQGYRLVTPTVRGGTTFRLTLYWAAQAPITQDYTVFVHFLAPDGFDVLGYDQPPRNDQRPTTGWQTGEIIIDPRAIPLPPDMPGGEYQLALGLYDKTGKRLTLLNAKEDQVLLPVKVKVE